MVGRPTGTHPQNHGYYILLAICSVCSLDHLGGSGGTVVVGGNDNIHAVEGLVACHAGHVNILHASHLLVGIDVLNSIQSVKLR